MTTKEAYKLFQKVKANDKKAFEDIFHVFYEEMCQYSFRIVKCQQTVEEIVSDVFYNIWKNRNSLNIEDVKAYLFICTKNETLRFIKKSKVVSEDVSSINNLMIDNATPESALLFSELQESYEKAYLNLEGQPKKVYNMHKSCNKSYKEISIELGLSIKTVENHMATALRQIRERLSSYKLHNIK